MICYYRTIFNKTYSLHPAASNNFLLKTLQYFKSDSDLYYSSSQYTPSQDSKSTNIEDFMNDDSIKKIELNDVEELNLRYLIDTNKIHVLIAQQKPGTES